MTTGCGYREIIHTADIALQVWAPTLEELFRQAAKGMGELMKLKIQEPGSEPSEHEFRIEGIDGETLLVLFLSELLFYVEKFGFGFRKLDLTLDENVLEVKMVGGQLIGDYLEIKAVTFHELNIQATEDGYLTTIVFDI